MNDIKVLLYLGDTLVGDINKYTKSRHLSEGLKSEQESASSDQLSFSINWQKFKEFVATQFDDNPVSFLRVGKTRVVFVINDRIRFSGFLATKPARSGLGTEQMLQLTFFEHFARLSGDLVVSPSDKMSPYRSFTNRPAHLYVQDLIGEFMVRTAAAGETLKWIYGTVNPLSNKTIEYKDFQTISKALCDAMNNVTGAGKFDVTLRADPTDYTRQIIDILKPRGTDKNIIVKFPGDGVYKLWSSSYEVEESADYASEVLVSGNGQVGDPATGEDTAELGSAINLEFVQEYCYWRAYDTQSNLQSQNAVQEYADRLLAQRDFGQQVPQITLVGRPIEWGVYDNENNGLGVGDSFYFEDSNDDGADNSGQVRIIGLETDYDDIGVATVTPALMRVDNV